MNVDRDVLEPGAARESGARKILSGIVTSVITAALLGAFAQWKLSESERIRGHLQGVWMLRTLTTASDYGPYKDMTVDFLVSVTVDASYNVAGDMYKIAEHVKGAPSKTYDRRDRMHGSVKGSVIGDRVMLTFDALDGDGLRSAHAFQGMLSFAGAEGRLDGDFRNDVANQTGRFCANRVPVGAPDSLKSFASCGL